MPRDKVGVHPARSYHLRPRAGAHHSSIASSLLAESNMHTDQELSATAAIELLQPELSHAVGAGLKESTPTGNVEEQYVAHTLSTHSTGDRSNLPPAHEPGAGATAESYNLSIVIVFETVIKAERR